MLFLLVVSFTDTGGFDGVFSQSLEVTVESLFSIHLSIVVFFTVVVVLSSIIFPSLRSHFSDVSNEALPIFYQYVIYGQIQHEPRVVASIAFYLSFKSFSNSTMFNKNI